jgi:cytochrome c oxidase assembly protein subunit 15
LSVPHKQVAGDAVELSSPEFAGPCCGGFFSSPALFARLVVAATFSLIFVGAMVTTHQAGMAVPDWPLSFGSLNPDGWWEQHHVRLEHGHRLFAMVVGLLVGTLTAWVWASWRSLLLSIAVMAILPPVSAKLGASRELIMHLAIWPAAAAFVASLLLHARGRALPFSRTVRILAVTSFFCVCAQATLGGLRVTQETAGALQNAMVLRIVHGIFGQMFLCVNVALAALLSARWLDLDAFRKAAGARTVRTLAWLGFAAVYLQLIVAAIMRHMGAGLAIPTFPAAAPDGSWLPATHSAYVDINFLHTRVGAIVVTLLLIAAAVTAYRKTRDLPQLTRPALGIALLVLVQFALGVFVIWHTKPPTLTSLHVLNGAALLATSLLLAMRASRVVKSGRELNPASSL